MSIIERVKRLIPIETYVGTRTELRPSPRGWRGPCPLHGGSRDSLAVFRDTQTFHCFTCAATGDVVGFVAIEQNMRPAAAARWLEKWAGLTEATPEERRQLEAARRRLEASRDARRDARLRSAQEFRAAARERDLVRAEQKSLGGLLERASTPLAFDRVSRRLSDLADRESDLELAMSAPMSAEPS